jgi:pimeloyl-ACP methyl ester carboxylesterase
MIAKGYVTWADDLRRLCDALGLRKPVVLGSSLGGFVALTYAALFPDHPGGVILANTTGGGRDEQRQLPEETTSFVRLPGARHTIFRDRPDLAFPAVKNFVSQITKRPGFTWEHPAHLYFRRAKSSELLFGGPAVYHERLLNRLGI